MICALLFIPLLAGIAAFYMKANGARRILFLATVLAHNAMTLACWSHRPLPVLKEWLALDDIGLLFLSITSLLFLPAAVYAIGYLKREEEFDEIPDAHQSSEGSFTGCLLIFLSTASMVTVCQHFSLLWVAVEATTLATAPLVYFHRTERSLEATWKYLLVCSVGIAIALLGTFLLGAAASPGKGVTFPLVLNDLVKDATFLNVRWLKVAFVFLLVGYGTKMGLFPMHTWLPDAHSEAPSVVSALLSGALLNCAFLAIVRAYQVCVAAGLVLFCRDLLVLLGLLSMAVSAVFIMGQRDYKRMLAYSSIEHMGILALGIGIGGSALLGAMLHAVNHSITKALLFLTAGNVLSRYKTKSMSDVTGLCRTIPISGALWMIGFLAITGSPPFGIFMSKFTILRGALEQHLNGVATIYLALLVLIFIGMGAPVLRMFQGTPRPNLPPARPYERWMFLTGPMALAALALMLGIYIPQPLQDVLVSIAKELGAP